jgi:D-beta-D-heptose 7-phosphate kinase / D-beta-D-heptose 1-phosphate adenosyltransferase
MDKSVFGIIEAFSNTRVLVIGEAMLDIYLKGTTDHLCREAPVPVVEVAEREDVPGGAANAACNLSSLGARVKFLSVIGDDIEGAILKKNLEVRNIDTGAIIADKKRKTLNKQRIVADAQLVVRFDQGTTSAISREDEERLIKTLRREYASYDTILLSDYAYGILTPGVIQSIQDLQKKSPRMIIVDSKRLSVYSELCPALVKPNYQEALALLGLQKVRSKHGRINQMIQSGEKILELTNAQIAAITLDEDGAVIFERDNPVYRTYAKPAPDSKAAGAGDTYISALALALTCGAPTPAAAEIASAAAGIVVQKSGTSLCDLEELKASYYGDEKFASNAFVLAARLASHRRHGSKVVFTNGCFDILHSGHVAYLNQAKAFGDVLIVGINSDESVKRLKGENRPINPLPDRAQVLAALSSVDLIVPFDEDTPKELIRAVRPDVFVKGGDYSLETLPEADLIRQLGGEVKILPYMDDHSTSGMIDRIRQLYVGEG